MVEISGQCEARFNAVKDLMAQSIAAGDDIGASFAVSLDGEMVVDLWGGKLDAEGTQAWQQDTIVNVYSTTKPMSFLCALVLASRGLALRARQWSACSLAWLCWPSASA